MFAAMKILYLYKELPSGLDLPISIISFHQTVSRVAAKQFNFNITYNDSQQILETYLTASEANELWRDRRNMGSYISLSMYSLFSIILVPQLEVFITNKDEFNFYQSYVHWALRAA